MLSSLKRIDSVLISKKEKDNAKVWKDEFKYTKMPEVKDPAKVPAYE